MEKGAAISRERVSLPGARSFRFAMLVAMSFLGCGGVVGPSSQPPPPVVPGSPAITLAPTNVSVLLGAPQAFTASVTNSAGSVVNWSVEGIEGGNPVVGTISAAGIFVAPRDMTGQNTIAVQASVPGESALTASTSVAIMSDIALSLAPQPGPVNLGATTALGLSFTSAGNPDRTINWYVLGAGCNGAACGTIDSAGNYTAPPVVTNPPSVAITAVSFADPSKSATEKLNLSSSFSFTMNGPATVTTGSTATFLATLVPAPGSNPSPAIAWSLNGTGCVAASCGTISPAGLYIAPSSIPAPTAIQILATPAADPSKSISVSVEILPYVAVAVSPASVTMQLGGTQTLSALVTGAADTTVTWDAGGVVGGNATYGTIHNSQTDPNDTTYTAPLTMPSAGSVTLHARSNANPAFSCTVIVNFIVPNSVSVLPLSSVRTIGRRQTFTIQVNSTSNQGVHLYVAGIPGGSAAFGQICLTASNPCQPILSTATGSFDYLAPAGVPSPNPVNILATSDADASQSVSVPVTILPHDVVSVLPASMLMGLLSWQQFTATVLGTDNQQVTWNIGGTACSIPGTCGTISLSGVFLAPPSVPSPDLITLTATSADDTSQKNSATVVISSSTNILLSPTSAYAGASVGFTLQISGTGFTPSSPGPGSTIVVAGTSRQTTCISTSVCETFLTPSDLQSPASLPVTVLNPGGAPSNTAIFVVVDPGSGADTILLTPQNPSIAGKDITVVDLSTNGGSDVGVNVGAFGPYSLASAACTLGGSPFVVTRPTTGTATAEICLFSQSGLDASYNFAITGPATPDITIINREPLGLGIVHLTLQVPSTDIPGSRTLFIQNSNEDNAAATGVLEVQ